MDPLIFLELPGGGVVNLREIESVLPVEGYALTQGYWRSRITTKGGRSISTTWTVGEAKRAIWQGFASLREEAMT